ncbi:MAG: glycosyltransferase [Actinobacteria bacterium]|nr:glycosyltransferase [Actinomycetota bacterium]
MPTPSVTLVHDYLTQRGGAERVVLSAQKAFPEAILHTSLYDPDATFPEFRDARIATLPLDRVRLLRRNHRLALPLLAPAFSRYRVEADVVLCSSSGWAHGVAADGRKVVYCHAPARWLYQTRAYLGGRHSAAGIGLAFLRPYLRRWDRRAAASADRYLANSTVVRDRIRAVYGIDAEVVPPPPALDPAGPQEAVEGIEPGFVLCVSRLLPYKNVDAVVEAFAGLPHERLVVVGTGPAEGNLRAAAGANVRLVGSVTDEQLRWLYASSAGLVAASYEDYGLTPLEAASFGRPAAVLRAGGFLDTVVEGETGVFLDRLEPRAIAAAVRELERGWDEAALRRHAATFSEKRFIERLRAIVLEEAS